MENLSNHDESSISQSSTWWRWLVLPFACVVGSLIGAMLVGLFQWFFMKILGGFSEDGWYFLYILPTITSAAFGYLWVSISYYVAPKGKRITAIVMTTLLVTLLVLVTLFSLFNPNYGTGDKVQSVLGAIATVATAIYAIVDFND